MSGGEQVQRIERASAVSTEYGSHQAPQLTVASGESFVVETNDNLFNTVADSPDLSQLGRAPLQAQQVLRANPVAGPIFVEGVRAGDTLVVEIESIDVRDWGWTGILPGVGPMDGRVGWEELSGPFATVIRHEPGPSGTLRDGEAVMRLGRESRWPLAPFIGTIATAPERGVENTVVTAGPWGGNLDVRDVCAGHRIHLNAAHDGGLLFLGDVHASQADSELTAIANETAADVRLRCEAIPGRAVPGVCRIETPSSLIQVDASRRVGSPEAALESCFTHMIEWLVHDHDMEPREAYLHMTANSAVRVHVYQFTIGLFTCGVEFPKANL